MNLPYILHIINPFTALLTSIARHKHTLYYALLMSNARHKYTRLNKAPALCVPWLTAYNKGPIAYCNPQMAALPGGTLHRIWQNIFTALAQETFICYFLFTCEFGFRLSPDI